MQTCEQGLCLECLGYFEIKVRTCFISINFLIEIVTQRVNGSSWGAASNNQCTNLSRYYKHTFLVLYDENIRCNLDASLNVAGVYNFGQI